MYSDFFKPFKATCSNISTKVNIDEGTGDIFDEIFEPQIGQRQNGGVALEDLIFAE